MALENEIFSLKGFAKNLASRQDVEAFEQVMDAARNYVMAGGNAVRPVVFEAMAMYVMLFQQKQIIRLEKELETLKNNSNFLETR